MNFSEQKKKNYCLLQFGSKRAADVDGIKSVIEAFAARGYYFDKISYVVFNDSEEIVRAVKDGTDNYENLVIRCPSLMEQTLKTFISQLKEGNFDGTGQLDSGQFSAFILLSDGDCFLNENKIADVLDKKYAEYFGRAYIRTVGAPRAKLNGALNAARTLCDKLDFNVRETFGDASIEIVYSDTTPKSAFDAAYRAILTKLNDYVYALEDISLAKRLVELLKLRRMKISVAESFTGGGVGKRIVEISGASEVYDEGLNTYSNRAKTERLGVSEEILRAHGAVSEETAAAMAEGLIARGHCDVAVATTGIAGPASDNTRKPVGLLYIAVAVKEKVSVFKYNLGGDRENITQTAINLALYLAFKTIK